jgi:hypothetical protein
MMRAGSAKGGNMKFEAMDCVQSDRIVWSLSLQLLSSLGS